MISSSATIHRGQTLLLGRRSFAKCIYFFSSTSLAPGAENSAEDERHLRQVGGPRLARRSLRQAEDGRPHPGRQRHQPGGDGVQRVSVAATVGVATQTTAACCLVLTASCRPQGPRTDPLVRGRPATAGGQDGLQVRRRERAVSQVLKEEEQEEGAERRPTTSAIGGSKTLVARCPN